MKAPKPRKTKVFQRIKELIVGCHGTELEVKRDEAFERAKAVLCRRVTEGKLSVEEANKEIARLQRATANGNGARGSG